MIFRVRGERREGIVYGELAVRGLTAFSRCGMGVQRCFIFKFKRCNSSEGFGLL